MEHAAPSQPGFAGSSSRSRPWCIPDAEGVMGPVSASPMAPAPYSQPASGEPERRDERKGGLEQRGKKDLGS